MWSKKPERSSLKKILVITLSNIGDVVLTFPVLDVLIEHSPLAEISVVTGSKAKTLFSDNPFLKNVYVFRKRQSLASLISWVRMLRKERFDLVVDLRHTALGLFLGARRITPLIRVRQEDMHCREKHLRCLKTVFDFDKGARAPHMLFLAQDQKDLIHQFMLRRVGMKNPYVVVASGTANLIKTWTPQGFAAVCDALYEAHGLRSVLVGDENDRRFVTAVAQGMKTPAINICGHVNLLQLSEIIRGARLTLACDSAVMHIASYLNLPVFAIFGPTDPVKYGPWSRTSRYIRQERACVPCGLSGCPTRHECMTELSVAKVLGAIEEFLDVLPKNV